MSDPTKFHIPRRRLLIATYAASDATLLTRRDVGVINSAEATMERETAEYNAVDVSGDECREYVADSNTTARRGRLVVELMSNVAANIALMLSGGTPTTNSAAAATQETCGAALVNGDVVQTNFIPDASTIVVKDSAGTPATLVLDTNYEFVAKNGSAIRFIDVSGFTQPFTIDYTRAASKTVSPLSDLNDVYDFVFSGANERDSCAGEYDRFFRVRPADEVTKLIHAAAETKTPQPMSVTFVIDRDPARSYAFGKFHVKES